MKRPSGVCEPGEKEIKLSRKSMGIAAGSPESTTDKVLRLAARLALPLVVLVALVAHYLASRRQPADETRLYFWLLGLILVCGVVVAAVPSIWTSRCCCSVFGN
jgi:hypothetical protein